MRFVGAAALFVVAAYCAYGIIATFEGPYIFWRALYVTVGMISLVGAITMVVRKPAPKS